MKKAPQEYSLHSAFTMLELVFVIVIIGILAAVIIPSTKTNPLQEAAIQLVSHIRYTQHLAMVDDKFDSNNLTWFKGRWQIKFSNTDGSDNRWAYAIFSDTGAYNGWPNVGETAVNPLNSSKRLTGGYSTGSIAYNDADATNKLNIGHAFSITDIDMTGGCLIADDGKKRISFDNLGRPIAGPLHYSGMTSPYKDIVLIQSRCNVILKNSEGNITIAIEPITGYTHILL